MYFGNFENLKRPIRIQIFEKKIFGKLVSDFLNVKRQKSAGRFKILPVGSKRVKKKSSDSFKTCLLFIDIVEKHSNNAKVVKNFQWEVVSVINYPHRVLFFSYLAI